MGFEIQEMFAFVVKDPKDQEEGILGFRGDDGNWVPMVGADMTRVDQLRPLADEMAKELDLTYRIKHFIYVDDLP